jgi:acyl-CoA hydrolase
VSDPERYEDADDCARAIAERLGGRVNLALPLGIGKSAAIANALYRCAREDPTLELRIFTALTLELPHPRSELEARFLTPLVERLYADVPTLDYAADLRAGRLPQNVRVIEFYLRPGAYLGIEAAQRGYTSTNYSNAARDLLGRGVNVVAQMVVREGSSDGPSRYSLSSNPDLTLDLMDAARAAGIAAPLLVGEQSVELPFMRGDAVVEESSFDMILSSPGAGAAPFPVPSTPVPLAEHAIGIRAACLVRDGGTLQIGIGSLGDAVAHAIGLRHTDNRTFQRLVRALDITEPTPETAPFTEGLYGASEMLVEGFLHLRRLGVLSREVEDGIYLHAGFYLGSRRFYDELRGLPERDRNGIAMSRISFTNRLLGDEQRKRRQRIHARFVNNAMMVTLMGAVVSDGLEDGRVVSGVGGQHDFVAMAHELRGARSVIVLPATRVSGGEVRSNILWRYGHVTVPRHLRDLVVTEYGVADLRGRSDEEVIARLLNIADSRFQDALRRRAIDAGKLAAGHRVPERHRTNVPERLRERLARADALAALPFYPLGNDLTEEEAALSVALDALKREGSRRTLIRWAVDGLHCAKDPRVADALRRMSLVKPRSLKEYFYRALLSRALVHALWQSGRPLFPS